MYVIHKIITHEIKKLVHQLTTREMVQISGHLDRFSYVHVSFAHRSHYCAEPWTNRSKLYTIKASILETSRGEENGEKKCHESEITPFYVRISLSEIFWTDRKQCHWTQYTVTLHPNIRLFSSLNFTQVSFWTRYLFVSPPIVCLFYIPACTVSIF